jgi:hypothetical protein
MQDFNDSFVVMKNIFEGLSNDINGYYASIVSDLATFSIH